MTLKTDDTIPQVPFLRDFWVAPMRTIAMLRRKYGDLFRLHAPRGKIICAVGLDANRAFLVENQDKLSYGAGWDYVAPAIAELRRGIVFMDGSEHRWYRRVLASAFSPAAVAAHVPLMHGIVRRHLASWPSNGTIGSIRRTMCSAEWSTRESPGAGPCPRMSS